MQVTFNVSRSAAAGNGAAGAAASTYEVELAETATVLDGLLKIRAEQDGSLAFRSSCDRGLCGGCAMRINKKGRLACVLPVRSITKNNVVNVEPLRCAPVAQDVRLDMEIFHWRKMKKVQPWLSPRQAPPREYVLRDEDLEETRAAMRCNNCGLCDEGCTVIVVDSEFLGPAALTKGFRFTSDPRDGERLQRLRQLSEPGGVWDCTHCFEANGHCPQNIAPTDRIFQMRDAAILNGIKSGINNPKVARHYDSFAKSVRQSGWLDETRLAIESEGYGNVKGLLGLLPTALKAMKRGKAPLPYLHPKRPGAEHITRIFEKAEEK